MGNKLPNYPDVPVIGYGTITTANTAKDGTGTVVTLITASTNGTKIEGVKIQSSGANVQTVMRFFINNGQANSTAANNTYFADIMIPANSLSETDSMQSTYVPLNLRLPNGYKLNITIGTTVANALHVTALGGNY